MAKVVYDAVATLGTYKDHDGNEKRRYLKCGVVVESEKGLSFKPDAMPVTPDWNGWISFYPHSERDSGQSQEHRSPAPKEFAEHPLKNDPFADTGDDDDVGF